MYYCATNYGNFGPFKKHAEAKRWVEKLPTNVKPHADIRVLWEPLPWEICENVIGANLKDGSSEKERTEKSPAISPSSGKS